MFALIAAMAMHMAHFDTVTIPDHSHLKMVWNQPDRFDFSTVGGDESYTWTVAGSRNYLMLFTQSEGGSVFPALVLNTPSGNICTPSGGTNGPPAFTITNMQASPFMIEFTCTFPAQSHYPGPLVVTITGN